MDNVKELGTEIMGLARKQPELAAELTGIFDKVSRLVIRSSESLRDLMLVEDRRHSVNMLQTLKDFLPPSLRYCSSIRSFDG